MAFSRHHASHPQAKHAFSALWVLAGTLSAVFLTKVVEEIAPDVLNAIKRKLGAQPAPAPPSWALRL